MKNSKSALTTTTPSEVIENHSSVIGLIMNCSQEINGGFLPEDELDKLAATTSKLNNIANEVFPDKIHRDILQFLTSSLSDGYAPSIWEVTRHILNNENYLLSQKECRDLIFSLIDDCSLFIDRDSPELSVNKILINHANAIARKELMSLVSNGEFDTEKIREIIDKTESSTIGTDKIISRKLKKFRDSTNPVDRALTRIELKNQGLTPMEVNQLINDTAIKSVPPEVTSGAEFLLKSFGTSKWVYPGLLPSGVVTLLSGQAGSGKTAFSYNMMFSYLSNRPFVGEQLSSSSIKEVKKGLIINSDQPPSDAQEMLRSSPDTFNDSVRFDIIEHSWNLSYIIELEKMIQQNGYTFIIIDSYKAIHSHVPEWDENAPCAGTGIRELQRIASTYGVTTLVIHHAGHSERKGGHQSRGHSSIPDAASCVMTISSAPMDRNRATSDPNIRFIDISKIRNAERCQFTAVFNATNYRYDLCLDNEGQKRNQLSDMCNKILPFFGAGKNQVVTSESIINKFGNSSEQKMFVHKAIRKLEMRGIIQKDMSRSKVGGVAYTVVNSTEF